MRRQDILFRFVQFSLPDLRGQCTVILEKWYKNDISGIGIPSYGRNVGSRNRLLEFSFLHNSLIANGIIFDHGKKYNSEGICGKITRRLIVLRVGASDFSITLSNFLSDGKGALVFGID